MEQRPPRGTLPGEWDPPFIKLDKPERLYNATTLMVSSQGFASHVDGVLTPADCKTLIDAMMQQRLQPVSVSGHQSANPDQVGSVRATAWAPALATQLWQKMRLAVPLYRVMLTHTPTDWYAMDDPPRKEHLRWLATGVSPVLRFMRYEAGGEHNTHYDMGYDYERQNPEDKRRTLMSFVLYLTTCQEGTGGRTRFIEDGQSHLPVAQRNHDDWTRRAYESEVLDVCRPVLGRILMFDHRLAHDVEPYTGTTPRIIIRGDITYQAL